MDFLQQTINNANTGEFTIELNNSETTIDLLNTANTYEQISEFFLTSINKTIKLHVNKKTIKKYTVTIILPIDTHVDCTCIIDNTHIPPGTTVLCNFTSYTPDESSDIIWKCFILNSFQKQKKIKFGTIMNMPYAQYKQPL
jgi:hypothetical protein